MPLSRQKIKSIASRRDAYWSPGNVAVTDLTRFPHCVPPGAGGDAAKRASDEYVRSAEQDPTFSQYIRPTVMAPNRTTEFLDTWNSKRIGVEGGKKSASECSNFAYEAVAECLLDDEIRMDYDVLQAGSMYDPGTGQYLHNICFLVPKGEGSKLKGKLEEGKLPEGTLIIDPWARAMGHSVETSLFTSPENFAYSSSLYPLKINYNSAARSLGKGVEESVEEFREKMCAVDFFKKYGSEFGLDASNTVYVESIQADVAKEIGESIGLAPDESIKSIAIDRESRGLTIEIKKVGQEGTRSIDAGEYSRLVFANRDKPEHVQPVRVEPVRVEPVRVEPVRVEPVVEQVREELVLAPSVQSIAAERRQEPAADKPQRSTFQKLYEGFVNTLSSLAKSISEAVSNALNSKKDNQDDNQNRPG